MTVAQIEAGYPLTIYDYENDLWTRAHLDPGTLGAADQGRLCDLDARFLAATTAAGGFSELAVVPEAAAWLVRLPRRAEAELLGDVARAAPELAAGIELVG